MLSETLEDLQGPLLFRTPQAVGLCSTVQPCGHQLIHGFRGFGGVLARERQHFPSETGLVESDGTYFRIAAVLSKVNRITISSKTFEDIQYG